MSPEGHCLGCHRTRDEIKIWRTLDEAAQKELLAVLRERAGLPARRK